MELQGKEAQHARLLALENSDISAGFIQVTNYKLSDLHTATKLIDACFTLCMDLSKRTWASVLIISIG